MNTPLSLTADQMLQVAELAVELTTAQIATLSRNPVGSSEVDKIFKAAIKQPRSLNITISQRKRN